MQTEQLITVESFCAWHNVEFSFINTLHEFGLIELTRRQDTTFIQENDLKEVERLVRLHNDLQVNPEGVEVISYLLERLRQQGQKILELENRLRLYEE
jgi:chaperone modulatory protein CbpM